MISYWTWQIGCSVAMDARQSLSSSANRAWKLRSAPPFFKKNKINKNHINILTFFSSFFSSSCILTFSCLRRASRIASVFCSRETHQAVLWRGQSDQTPQCASLRPASHSTITPHSRAMSLVSAQSYSWARIVTDTAIRLIKKTKLNYSRWSFCFYYFYILE